MNPKVSIVIPVYNGEDYVKEAIDSALAQTYDNCEIIVVNDGSTDNTEAVVRAFGDKIRYFSKENGGVSSALNVGIEHMEGQYFQYLPHDDLLHPDKIKKNIMAIQESGDEMSIVWSGWNYNYMNGRGQVKAQMLFKYADKRMLTNSVYPLLFSLVNTVTVLINKKYFDRVGVFNQTLYTSQDYDMWFRTFIDQKTIYLEESLVDYRIHKEQGTQADPEFVKNCISLSEFMVSNLTEEQIRNMFGNKYRFLYYMLDFYNDEGWTDSYRKLFQEYQNCNEPDESIQERKELVKYLESCGYTGDNIVLYCAGTNARRLWRELKERGIHVKAFSDSDRNKIGTVIYGVECIAPEKIDKKTDLVIVTKDNPITVILDLQKKGVDQIITYEEIGSIVFQVLPIKRMEGLK